MSHGQAAYVLERLIADRRISQGDVNRYVGDMHREISELERRLETLRTHAGSGSTGGGQTGGAQARGGQTGGGQTSGGTTGARRGRPPGSGSSSGAGRSGGVFGGGRRRGRPAGSGAGSSSSGSGSESSGGGRGRRQRSAITPEQLASRRIQGRYLGLIRQIPASRRAQYQKIAKEKGREAAISELESALKK